MIVQEGSVIVPMRCTCTFRSVHSRIEILHVFIFLETIWTMTFFVMHVRVHSSCIGVHRCIAESDSDIHMWAHAPPIRFPGPWKETCWSFNIRGFIGYLNGGHGMSFMWHGSLDRMWDLVRWVWMVRVILFSLRLLGEWPQRVWDRGEIWIVSILGERRCRWPV